MTHGNVPCFKGMLIPFGWQRRELCQGRWSERHHVLMLLTVLYHHLLVNLGNTIGMVTINGVAQTQR